MFNKASVYRLAPQGYSQTEGLENVWQCARKTLVIQFQCGASTSAHKAHLGLVQHVNAQRSARLDCLQIQIKEFVHDTAQANF